MSASTNTLVAPQALDVVKNDKSYNTPADTIDNHNTP